MPNLDIKPVKKFEAKQLAACNELLTQQIALAWEETRSHKLPKAYGQVKNIVFVGMGGSSLGGHLLQSVFSDRLSLPFELVRNYTLPKYVNSKSLVILSSFSGTTEEVLVAASEAKKRRAKILVLTTGGNLAKLAKREGYAGYIFEPKDLAPEPRMGLGFSLIGAIGLLRAAGLLKVSASEIENLKRAMNEVIDSSAPDVSSNNNPAKQVALSLKDKSILLVAAEHLVGNAHVAQNQINETAKQFAVFAELPELNHHLLEGLTFPKGSFQKFAVLMIKSKLYSKKVSQRFEITADLLERQGGLIVEYVAGGGSKLEEVGELLQFSAYVAGYLSMLNKVDPMDIPWVEEFKAKMAKIK